MGLSSTAVLGLITLCVCANVAHSLTIIPKTDCPPVCKMYCPGGNVLDENGCPICKCKPAPPPKICPLIACDNTCPNGRVKDSNGCDLCDCIECPLVRCPLQFKCPFGFGTDRNGCPTCDCRFKPICEEKNCENICLFGYEKDQNGCDTCKCKLPVECPEIACPIFGRCRNGYVIDERGCNTCRCKPDPCPALKCRHCPNGYVEDVMGCQTCQCKPPQCPSHVCDYFCAMGVWFADELRKCGCKCRERIAY